MENPLGYVRLGELIPQTVFTTSTLKFQGTKFATTNKKTWKFIRKWVNYADSSDKHLIQCAPLVGGIFQTKMMSFLSIDEMVSVKNTNYETSFSDYRTCNLNIVPLLCSEAT